VAIVGELEGSQRGGAEADVIPLRKPERASRWRVARWQWLAAAAVVAGIAVVPLVRRGPSTGDAVDPGTFVDALASEDAGLPAGWNGRPWSTTRAATDPLTPEARAVRIGARLVDLELAVRGRDTVATQLAAEVAELLEPIPASAPVISVYRELSRSGHRPWRELRPLMDQGVRGALALAGEEFASFGAWLETARIATSRRDIQFFRARQTRLALERARTLTGLAPEVSARIERIRSASVADRSPDWDSLYIDLTELLGANAS
jgi:hypothetical protein